MMIVSNAFSASIMFVWAIPQSAGEYTITTFVVVSLILSFWDGASLTPSPQRCTSICNMCLNNRKKNSAESN